MTQWKVDTHLIKDWFLTLSQRDAAYIGAAIAQLEQLGPALGRPLVDTIKQSRFKNMKELRPPSKGASEIRILFAFDPERKAIMLIAGDKANAAGIHKALKWNLWYRSAIPQADKLYEEHLNNLKRRKA